MAAEEVIANESQLQARESAAERPRGVGVAQPSRGHALWRSLSFLRAHAGDMAGAAVSMLLVSAANLAAPQLLRQAIDQGITGRQPAALWLAVGGLTAIALGRGLCTFLQEFLTERASQGVAYDLRAALYAQTQRLGFSYFDHARTGQLLTNYTNDVETIRTLAGGGIMQLFAAVLMLLGCVMLLCWTNWRLTLIALAVVPLVFALLIRFLKRLGPLVEQTRQTLEQLNNVLQESLAGVRLIRAFGREEFEAARYGATHDTFVAKNIAIVRLLADTFPLIFLVVNLGVLAVVWYGGAQVIGGRMTVGELVAFNSYLGFLLFPLISIGFLLTVSAQATVAAARIFEVLDATVEVRDAPGARALPDGAGRVEFIDVHFRYPGSEQEVLHGLNLTVEAGQTAALIGPTGCGKSTLLHLLPRFYDVTAGSIRIDGYDVQEITLESLRRQVAVVLQETLLFRGSVRDNIAYGRPDAPLAEVVQAACAARADDFIRALPDGYDTIIGERGVGLSGGQRQRLAIARALLIKPRILLLDDSTSAVDAETETAILQSLDRLIRDGRHTSFVIAHRISTVRAAHVIFLLDEGQVVARGTHEELLRASPLYQEILAAQLAPGQSL